MSTATSPSNNLPAHSPIPLSAHSPRSPRSPAVAFEDPPPEHDDPPDEYHSAHDDFAADEHDGADNANTYPEPTPSHSLLPPPTFRPFFTLITDATTADHAHPSVHYVFADDDPAIVTAAAIRSLGLDDTKFLPSHPPQAYHGEGEGDDEAHPGGRLDDYDGEEAAQAVESPLPPPPPATRERFLLIDVAADGQTVLAARSLCPEWQITSTSTRVAPSFDENAPDGGLMLQIEGVEVAGGRKIIEEKGRRGERRLAEAREREDGDLWAVMEGLVEGVERGIEVAGRVKGGSEGEGAV